MAKVEVKKFIVIPRDAAELLEQRFADFDTASQTATDACAESGQAHYVVELKAIATRETPPVKVRRL